MVLVEEETLLGTVMLSRGTSRHVTLGVCGFGGFGLGFWGFGVRCFGVVGVGVWGFWVLALRVSVSSVKLILGCVGVGL